MNKLLRFFRPSHQHTAFSATLLLISAVMLSRVIGYARDAYIAWAYGAGGATDAYVAAFTLPDFLNYIVAGGAASITFISIYTRFLAEKRDALQQHLAQHGVPTIIYYPSPLHLQRVYAPLGHSLGDFPVAEDVSRRILPLPIYPELTDEQVDYVIETIRGFEW